MLRETAQRAEVAERQRDEQLRQAERDRAKRAHALTITQRQQEAERAEHRSQQVQAKVESEKQGREIARLREHLRNRSGETTVSGRVGDHNGDGIGNAVDHGLPAPAAAAGGGGDWVSSFVAAMGDRSATIQSSKGAERALAHEQVQLIGHARKNM